MSSKKRIKCKFCDDFFYSSDGYADHMETKHNDMIPSDMSSAQYIYFLKTGKTHGNCIVCKHDTLWNEKTNKYKRLCENPKCKEVYRKKFENNMIGKYGKVTLLNDPEQQKIMLSKRKISGTYIWSDRKHEFTYTGTYERDFLIFLDRVMDMDPDDIMTPSPHTYYYTYENKRHFYFPDVFIPSLNLEIEIKDGGTNPNTHPKIVAVDKIKEKLKDEVMKSNKNTFNYLKITDRNHIKFLKYLEEAKNRSITGDDSKIIML